MEELKRSRGVARTKFTKAKKSLLEAVNKAATLTTIKARYEKFKKAWDNVQTHHEKVAEIAEDEDAILQAENWIDAAITEYDDTEILIDNYIE